MRLFFAIPMPRQASEALQLVQDHLPRSGVRYSMACDFHLTLKFLGECDSTKALEAEINVNALLTRVSLPAEALALEFTRVDCFKRYGRPSVIWAGVKMSSDFYQFQKDLEYALEPLGFEVERQRFKPHVTLARVREFDDRAREAWLDAFSRLGVKRFSFALDHFDLMESHLEPDQPPRYNVLTSFTLS